MLWLLSGLSTVFNMVQEFGTAVLRIAEKINFKKYAKRKTNKHKKS